MLKAVDERAVRGLREPAPARRVLFLAQMPPPIHGVTTMSRRVRTMMEATPGLDVEHLWLGGARTLHDVGKASLRKVTGFGWLCARLAMRGLAGRRYDFTYQTLAPHGDAALRDGILIALSKRLTGRALVHLHTQGLEEILAGATLRRRLLRRMIGGTELIAISGHVADMARRSGIFSRVHDLPNLIVDPGNPDCASAERLKCGYLGNYDPRKGVLRFIDSIAAIRAAGVPVDAAIAGGPTKHLSVDDVCAYAASRGVGDVVRVLGFVSETEKHDLFRCLDLFIYPTDHDLAPLVVLEAMALGAAPIVFDTGGLREMVGPDFADHVITEKHDPAAFTSRIAALASGYARDPARLVEAKRRARRRYESNYTPEIYERRLAKILDDAHGAA
ncbi:MAG: glycosyltransferase family 4 protein [Gammaproteobacteria bacterium]